MSKKIWLAILVVAVLALVYVFCFANIFQTVYRSAIADEPEKFIPLPVFNRADYDARLLALAHISATASTTERNAGALAGKNRVSRHGRYSSF